MCGIVGFKGVSGSREQQLALIGAMTETLRHRGPDDGGTDLSGDVALGHRRLSILDLSPTGHQPMFSPDGQVRIVFNGEFYDYKEPRAALEREGVMFRSSGDTEVILHLYLKYDLDFVRHIDGMFAVAIDDRRKNRLVLARDRIGKKPLYTYADGPLFAFASETKPFRLLPGFDASLDMEALAEYLTFLYIQAPSTALQKVRQLPPAHLLVLENGAISIRRYWEPARIEVPQDEAGCLERFDALFTRAVQRRLVADVEVGAFLSGGLDSSMIAVVAQEQLKGRLKTFNVRFPGEGYFDESEPAARVAAALKTEHFVEEVRPDIANLLPQLVQHYDDPYADSSAVPTFCLSRMTAKHVKVVLSGTGADDLFAGYRRHNADAMAQRLSFVPASLLRLAGRFLGLLPQSRRTRLGETILLASRFLSQAGETPEGRYLGLIRFLSQARLESLFQKTLPDPTRRFKALLETCPRSDPVSRALWLDLFAYVPGDLLVKEDRAAMAFGLEGRMPFLDRDLVEFALSLPPEMKIRGKVLKYLPRRWAKGRVPDFVLGRKKHGFRVPIGEWMREELKDFSHDVLLGSSTRIVAFLDRAMLEKLWNEHQRGIDQGSALYALLMLELWLQHARRAPDAGG